MMTNLFSVFDPSTSQSLSLNWMMSLLILVFFAPIIWKIPSRPMMIIKKTNTFIFQEFKTVLGGTQPNFVLIFMTSTMLFILINNIMGLFPYTFTSTSHMVTTLSMSLPLWVAFMLMGWFNNTKHMLAHLVPQSTPPVLMPFMVLIESISNLIRPFTLAIRLSANMIAGHLLMTLLGEQASSNMSPVLLMILIVQFCLLTLESAVAMIQSYVFTILTTLYASEL
uniref:ATP synthase subunit a n=1 Tax=Neelus murinus TaxID=1348065 RepID=A0A6B9IP32_9HEXA|nr:ATP synthase F0 subunit 6 [Neelus murinus]